MEKNEEKKSLGNELTYEQLMEYYDTSCGAWCIDQIHMMLVLIGLEKMHGN